MTHHWCLILVLFCICLPAAFLFGCALAVKREPAGNPFGDMSSYGVGNASADAKAQPHPMDGESANPPDIKSPGPNGAVSNTFGCGHMDVSAATDERIDGLKFKL